MKKPFLVQPPPICDDPNCLNCRINTLFAVSKALEMRGERTDDVTVEQGAIFTLVHSVAALLDEAGVPLKEQIEMLTSARRLHRQKVEAEKSSGLPRQTHITRNSRTH